MRATAGAGFVKQHPYIETRRVRDQPSPRLWPTRTGPRLQGQVIYLDFLDRPFGDQIRNLGVVKPANARNWVANDDRMFSFEIDGKPDINSTAVNNLMIYEYSADHKKLQTVYTIPKAIWERESIKIVGQATKSVYSASDVSEVDISHQVLDIKSNPFNNLTQKPNHLSSAETREQIDLRESEVEKRVFQIALQKKYLTLLLPLVVMLFTAPFALSLSRKGKAMTVGYAVGIWLLFMGITSVFDQLGQNGYISPEIAVWSPVLLFAILGAYLLTKVKT